MGFIVAMGFKRRSSTRFCFCVKDQHKGIQRESRERKRVVASTRIKGKQAERNVGPKHETTRDEVQVQKEEENGILFHLIQRLEPETQLCMAETDQDKRERQHRLRHKSDQGCYRLLLRGCVKATANQKTTR